MSGRLGYPEGPVVLYDGECGLCDGFVRWLLVRDDEGTFRYASLQSFAAKAILSRCHSGEEPLPDTVVLIDGEGLHIRSTAVLRVVSRLGLPWRALAWLRIVPLSVRDSAYRLVARHRHRWFGSVESCVVPPQGLRERFLDLTEE